MRKLEFINTHLIAFESKFKLPVMGCDQGSDVWKKTKLGVISASNAHKAVAKADSETRNTYMCELVAEVCTGQGPEEFNFKACEWGKFHEPSALSAYSFQTNLKTERVPFIFKDDTFRVGCSPDALVVDTHGLELKCPYNTANYIKFLTDDTLKPEWMRQVQFCMWVTDASLWDVAQYDPRMKTKPLHVVTIERDEKQMKIFDELIPAFISDMDKLLELAGAKYFDQWGR